MYFILAQTADELMQSARGHHARGVVLAQYACVVVALIFFYGAYTTLKRGFKVSETKSLVGKPARIIASLIGIVGVAIIAFGIFYLPSFAL